MKKLIAASFVLIASGALAAPGQFDPAFGQQGVSVVPATSGGLADVVLDGGRIVATGTTYGVPPEAAATIVGRWLAGGTLDPSFGTQGVRRLEPISGATRAALAIRSVPSGYLVLDVLDPAATNHRISIARLLPDGQTDATYGGSSSVGGEAGRAIVYTTFKSAEAFADGALLLFGQDLFFPLGWVGLTVQGQPDPRWILSSASPYLQCPGYPPGRNGYSAPSPGNKVLVAIPVKSSGTAQPAFCLTRLNADGTVDATYGASGHALIQDARFGTADYSVDRVVVDTDGSAVLDYSVALLGNPSRFMYVTAGGALDVARGDAGLLVPDPNVLHFASAIALQPDGKLLVAGYPAVRIHPAASLSPDLSRPRVLRLTRQGAVDPSYGPLGQGYASLADATRIVRPNAMRVDASGDLVLAGIVRYGPESDMVPAVAKLQGDRPAPPMESSGGGGGGGCGTIRGPGPFDPVLPSLALLSAWILWRRRCTRSSSSSRTSSGTS